MGNIREKLKDTFKNPKNLMILGIAGILFIFLSSLLPSSEGEEGVKEAQSISSEQYRVLIEQSIGEIVTGISGDKRPTVVVTLESGVFNSYADASETDSSNSNADSAQHSSESKKQSFVTITDASGGERALLVTEYMPQIRGVAIVCSGGDREEIGEKIKNAVTAALNITSKRVYIAGGNDDEKG